MPGSCLVALVCTLSTTSMLFYVQVILQVLSQVLRSTNDVCRHGDWTFGTSVLRVLRCLLQHHDMKRHCRSRGPLLNLIRQNQIKSYILNIFVLKINIFFSMYIIFKLSNFIFVIQISFQFKIMLSLASCFNWLYNKCTNHSFSHFPKVFAKFLRLNDHFIF